ncbi:nucleotide disphospho-sugar-binding domain-containing protein [Streptomyces sp. NPDC002677]|uniref:nucleotide disphospho-sugar-binding domain-containing protein n=1 Tax=Streptomyces sp. NPDC002677 TaxID=3154774 RepID=UPI003316B872
MAKIIVTASPLIGHIVPLAAIATDLTKRGHEVLFYTGAGFEEQILKTGARFAAYPAEVDLTTGALDARFVEREKLAPFERLSFDLKHLGADAAPAHDKRLQELLAEFPATVVFGEFTTTFGTMSMALRAPRGRRPLLVNIGITPPTFDSVDTAPFGPGLLPPTNDEERAAYNGMRAQMAPTFADVQQYVEGVFTSMGVTIPGPLFDAMARVPDHTLQLTVPAFEYPRSDAPEGFRFIGPLPAASDAGFERPDWWAELSSDRPVVVVTQGTVENGDLTQLVVPTLRALADADVTVVAATARPDGPDMVRAAMDGRIPANVHLAGFVPFEQLLPFADVLVTNAGYGGVQTALRHGVPLVVGGETEDKPEVAARVDWSGTGVNLRTARPEASAVRAAVDEVLGDPRYRKRASEIQGQYAQYEPFDSVAEIVEQA